MTIYEKLDTLKGLQLVIIKAVYFMNLTINNLVKGVQSAPFLACSGLAGSIPAASIKHIYIYMLFFAYLEKLIQ